jgi:hypothetical protein
LTKLRGFDLYLFGNPPSKGIVLTSNDISAYERGDDIFQDGFNR